MMKQLLTLSILTLSLSACWYVETTKVYNRNLTKGESYSEPISLSFQDNKDASFYFLLARNIPTEQFMLKVRWVSPHHALQFQGKESTLKFLVNKEEILTLIPIAAPKIASYRVDEGGIEEEAIYTINRDQLTKLTQAKTVSVELTGKYKIVTGTFNRFHTFRAFRDFLKNG